MLKNNLQVRPDRQRRVPDSGGHSLHLFVGDMRLRRARAGLHGAVLEVERRGWVAGSRESGV
jgi:hypothetical protein